MNKYSNYLSGYVIAMNSDSEVSLGAVNIDAYNSTALKHITDHVMLDHNLNTIAHLPFGPGKGFMVKRWKLRQVLQEVILFSLIIQRIDLLQGINVKWGKQFVRYEEHEDKVVAFFEDGSTAEGDILIGSDGANSRVRRQRTKDIMYHSFLSNIRLFFDDCSYEKLPVAHVVAYATYKPEDMPKLHELSKTTIVRVKGTNGVSMMSSSFTDNGDNVIAWTFNFNHPDLPEDAAEFKKIILEQAGTFCLFHTASGTYIYIFFSRKYQPRSR